MSISVGASGSPAAGPDPYQGKWIALSNTTLGMLMVPIRLYATKRG